MSTMKGFTALALCITFFVGFSGHLHADEEATSDVPASGSEKPLEKAENIDLEKPIEKLPEATVDSADLTAQDKTTTTEAQTPAEEYYDDGVPFVLLGKEVPPRTATRMSWTPSQSFEGIAGSTPVLVVNGTRQGPVLCLTAAIHGDELNGIEIVRRVMYDIEPEKLTGTVIGVPIVNLQGFRRNSRYLTDRRDLNRYFPGNPDGSLASRIAYSFFSEIIEQCSYLVDLHTGSFHRTNLPQIRADLLNSSVVELSQGFGSTSVLHSGGAKGTLRYAANMHGIPTVTLEAGEPMRLQDKEVAHGVKAIQTLMNKLDMLKKARFWGKPEPVFYESTWVRADYGGILFSEVFLGKRVKSGEVLGTVTDPITNKRHEVKSPEKGRVLGMALNQVVMPGFAAFRIGIEREENEVISPASEDPENLDSSGIDSSSTGDVAASDPDYEPETAE
ncbi:MAG: succinylglutamate desuccinylase/aspartoacylase family protein [Pseudomonadota bacterium]